MTPLAAITPPACAVKDHRDPKLNAGFTDPMPS